MKFQSGRATNLFSLSVPWYREPLSFTKILSREKDIPAAAGTSSRS